MKKISDFNNATEKYPVVYAGSATRPEFVDMPTTLQQQEGVAPMDTLPAQWWNAMWKLATRDINAFRDYVGDSITEINNLLTKFDITLEDANSEQLYDFFHNDYVQNYLNDIFVNKSGGTIDGDLHVKGNLSVDGIGEEIISTELKVGANTITLRNGNPSALGNTELAGVVTENYDGNNHNNIISIDKNGVARTGDIDIATRILYSNNGTNFFTDEDLTIPATIGETEVVRDTGNQTSGGVKIYEGVTYSNNDTQALATREDTPVDGALIKWDAASKKFVSANIETGVPVDVVEDGNMRAVTSNAVADGLNEVMPTGTILHGMWKTAPKGFLLCDGATYQTSQYPGLASVLEATGDTFKVPDLRNRTVMGANPDVVGKADGNTSNVGDVQNAQLPTIIGQVDHTASTAFNFGAARGAFYLRRSGKNNWYDHSGTGYNFGFDASIAGSSTDHLGNNVYTLDGEVRTANIRMNYIIKY